MEMRELSYGVEIETVGRTREAVARAIQSAVGGEVGYVGTADHPERRLLALLKEALGRNIQFIARHAHDYPQALFQCLWNSCWWYDCPESARHLGEVPSERMGSKRSPQKSCAEMSLTLCYIPIPDLDRLPAECWPFRNADWRWGYRPNQGDHDGYNSRNARTCFL